MTDDVAQVLPDLPPEAQVEAVGDAVRPGGGLLVGLCQAPFNFFICDWRIQHGVIFLCEGFFDLSQEFFLCLTGQLCWVAQESTHFVVQVFGAFLVTF